MQNKRKKQQTCIKALYIKGLDPLNISKNPCNNSVIQNIKICLKPNGIKELANGRKTANWYISMQNKTKYRFVTFKSVTKQNLT